MHVVLKGLLGGGLIVASIQMLTGPMSTKHYAALGRKVKNVYRYTKSKRM